MAAATTIVGAGRCLQPRTAVSSHDPYLRGRACLPRTAFASHDPCLGLGLASHDPAHGQIVLVHTTNSFGSRMKFGSPLKNILGVTALRQRSCRRTHGAAAAHVGGPRRRKNRTSCCGCTLLLVLHMWVGSCWRKNGSKPSIEVWCCTCGWVMLEEKWNRTGDGS